MYFFKSSNCTVVCTLIHHLYFITHFQIVLYHFKLNQQIFPFGLRAFSPPRGNSVHISMQYFLFSSQPPSTTTTTALRWVFMLKNSTLKVLQCGERWNSIAGISFCDARRQPVVESDLQKMTLTFYMWIFLQIVVLYNHLVLTYFSMTNKCCF